MSAINLRAAILAAADHIEAHPESFDFMETVVPDSSCGTPGCALGWIAFFAGRRHGSCHSSAEELGIDHCDFYNQMDDVSVEPHWTESAAVCAKLMREYADTNFPAVQS